MIREFIFDLDGVIVDTAKYHYLAWKELAESLHIRFTKEDNERLKGVSRVRSFEIILEIGGRTMDEEQKQFYCTQKNERYLTYIRKLKEDEILPGAKRFLIETREAGFQTAIGSASKNTKLILQMLKITDLFDAVIDGTMVSKAKPDPEVFLQGAQTLGIDPAECVVFEDAVAGIEAAHNAGMKAVGVGDQKDLPKADIHIKGFEGITPKDIVRRLQP